MSTEATPIVVDLPLRGEWVAVNTPGHRIPSHGTDEFGQRYAYDFVRIDRDASGYKFFDGPSFWRYLVFGVRLEDCYGWSQPIDAPFDGSVVVARDGCVERQPVHLARDLGVVLTTALTFTARKGADLRSVVGNHIIVKHRDKEVFAFLGHARCGSLRVREGDEVKRGQHIADVGHSGNSTAPHLHFHLMDGADLLTARGLPCSFQTYAALRDGVWEKVTEGIPGKREFIRCDA